MKDSVASEALVMPSSTRCAMRRLPAVLRRRCVFVDNAGIVDLLAAQEAGVPAVHDLGFPQHLAHDDLDVLVVDLDALQAVDVLDFLHQVIVQRLHAQQSQNVVRVRLAVDDGFAFFHALAFEHDDVAPLRNQLLVGLAVVLGDDQALLALGVLAEADDAGDLGQDRRLFRFACFEQVGHAGQTTGDVTGLRRFLRNARQNVTHVDFLAILHLHDGAGLQEVMRRDLGTGQAQFLALAHRPG